MLSGWKLGFTISLLAPALIAQQQSSGTSKWFPATPIGNPNATAGTIPVSPEMLPQVAPVFVEDGTTTSLLIVLNNSAISAGAAISVRGLSGDEAVHNHVSLKPHEQREISIQTLLSSLSAPPTIGSVTVTQDTDLKGLTVVSQMLITSQRGASPSYIDEELAMPVIGGSTTLRGVADEALGSALIAVASIVSWTQQVTIHCLSRQTQSQGAVITLRAQATVLISNCSGQTVNDLDSYSTIVNQNPQHEIRGYELETDGGIGTIAAFGLAYHSHNQDRVFSAIPFIDPATIHAANRVFAGVPFGTQPALPDGVYTPRITFTNFSSSPAHVTVSIATTQPGDSSSPSVTSASPKKHILQQLTLTPRRTAEVTLDDPGSQSGLQQSLIIENDRSPGDVLSKVVSRSDGSLYEIELLGKDQLDENNGGSHPWSVIGDAISHLLLFNYSDKPRVFGVDISNGLIVWDKKYTLASYETREVSINELIDDKIRDDRGQTLSPYRMSGVVNWMVPSSGEGTGRLMVTSHSRVLARNFSCGQFIVICGGTFASSSGLTVGSIDQVVTFYPDFCDEFSPSQCYGGSSVGGGSAAYNWSVGGSSIARLNSASDQWAQWPNIYGVGPGAGSASVEATAGNCQVYGGGGFPDAPTVEINGPNFVPLAKSGTAGGVNTIQLTATGSPGGGTYSWSASNSAVVTLTNASTATVTVQGASVGSSYVTVTYTVNGQPGTASQPVGVQQPTSLSASPTASSITCQADTGNYSSQKDVIDYTVLDQGTNIIHFAGIPVVESFSPISNSCANVPSTPTPSSWETLGTGHLNEPDTLYMCSNSCMPANSSGQPQGSCTYKFTQTFTANGFPVQTKTITMTCPGPPTLQ